jgi:tellurite resistance protein TerC
MLVWILFLAVVLVLLALDLGVFHRKDHVIGVREALAWSGFWIVLSLLFNILVYFAYQHHWLSLGLPGVHYPHGLDGKHAAVMFFTGYVLEKSLSIDNIFVIALIFSYFSIPGKYQHRVLFWGILGALVLRGAMIGVGAVLIAKFDFILYIFGAFLILTAGRMLFSSGETDLQKSWAVRAASRILPLTPDLHGHHFVTRQQNRWMFTPLALALVVVEATDLVFAVDSIPAIFVVTKDPFLVFTSNICAILGLRSLYFALAGIMDKFYYLKASLAVILALVGAKMLLHHWLEDVEGLSFYTLGVIALILGAGIVASLIRAHRQAEEREELVTDEPRPQ